jgi:hypothetical protein
VFDNIAEKKVKNIDYDKLVADINMVSSQKVLTIGQRKNIAA